MGLLRLILALSVVFSHAGSVFGYTLVGGQLAVQSFYMISGLYMAIILNEKYIGVNKSYKLFITNRLLRLYPVYWAVLLLTVIFSICNRGDITHNAMNHYVDYSGQMGFGSILFLVFTNIFLFLQDFIMFLGLDGTGNLFLTPDFNKTNPALYHFLFIPQAWTIGVEIAFYLVAPFIARRKLGIILTLIGLSVALRVILIHFGYKKDPWSYRFFPTELVFFLLGIVGYHINKKISGVNLRPLVLQLLFSAILGFTLFYSFMEFPGKHYAYLLVFACCLPFVFELTKKWKRDAAVGELSYPVYISHVLVFAMVKASGFSFANEMGLTVTILSVIFSMLLNKFIAKRIETFRQKRLKTVGS